MKRTCTVCLTDKELDEFPKAAHGKLCRRNQCRLCRNAYHRENSKLYYVSNRTDKLKKVKAYAKTNSESISDRMKTWRSQDARRELERERSRKRRSDPTGKKYRAFLTRRYQSLKLNAQGHTTRIQLQARWEYYGGRCWVCEAVATETDHVIPLSKGGTNWPANLKPICKPCNIRKGATWPYNPKLARNYHANRK